MLSLSCSSVSSSCCSSFSPLLLLLLLLLLPNKPSALETGTCIAPLGMESGAILDSQISASSSFEHSSVGPHNARIRVDKNGGAWCPKNMIGKDGGEWLQIDLGRVHVLTATETMGRFGNGRGAEYTESYLVEYWRPRLGRWVRYRSIHNKEVVAGNSNTYLAAKVELTPVVLASKVRFHPYSAHQRTICMRVEAYGCPYDDGLVSYSMDQGDTRGGTLQFYDWNYDGEWVGGRLTNGLGSLTDGNLGPADFKLSYYAQNRGWVGWKNDKRDFVEIIFEFDTIQELHSVQLYCNNQFSRDVSVFSEVRAYFSIGGEIYGSDHVSFSPLPDEIFEDPRNISMKLHRRVGRYLRLELYFSSKWILVSEVSFESSPARGEYSVEAASTSMEEEAVRTEVEVANDGTDSSQMPVIVGCLATVILLLAGVIFFIVTRSRRRRKLSGSTPLSPEKIALNCPEAQQHSLAYSYDHLSSLGASDSGQSTSVGSRAGGSASGRLTDSGAYPCLSLVPGSHESPRPPRSSVPPSPSNRRHNSTPISTPRVGGTPKTPRRRLISNPLAEPQPLYMEPYQVMRYSPYVAGGHHGLALSKETAILSDTSCGGDYAVPMGQGREEGGGEGGGGGGGGGGMEYSDSDSSVDRTSDYVFLQTHPLVSPLATLQSKQDSHCVPTVREEDVRPLTRLSQGTFGSVHTCTARVPQYLGEGELEMRLCAVKYMAEGASSRDREEFVREVQLLSGLEDENISRVLGLGSQGQDRPHFVVMEYLEHGDLTQFLTSHLPEDTPYLVPGTKTLSFPTLVYIAAQVASGMKYLESLNFVHRDLATRNCLVGRAYHIKICDFGTDNPMYRKDYVEVDGHLVPLRWMSWESVVEHRYTTKSDVWSFGVTLWEILNFCGVRPYSDLTQVELLQLLEARAVPALPAPRHCHRDLRELMLECWNVEEGERPSFREIQLFLQRKNLGYSPV